MDPETGVFLALLGGFVVAACIYLVPAMVAGLRSHPKRWSVFLVNLFLGWTLVGWVVALSWALKRYPETTTAKSFFTSVAAANRGANTTPLARPELNRPAIGTVVTILGSIVVIGAGAILLVVALRTIAPGILG